MGRVFDRIGLGPRLVESCPGSIPGCGSFLFVVPILLWCRYGIGVSMENYTVDEVIRLHEASLIDYDEARVLLGISVLDSEVDA